MYSVYSAHNYRLQTLHIFRIVPTGHTYNVRYPYDVAEWHEWNTLHGKVLCLISWKRFAISLLNTAHIKDQRNHILMPVLHYICTFLNACKTERMKCKLNLSPFPKTNTAFVPIKKMNPFYHTQRFQIEC